MDIKKFIVISVVAHLIMLIAEYFMPAPEKKKAKEFLTSLVTPEEARRPQVMPPPMPKPAPVPPEAVQKPRPIPPQRRAAPIPPRTLPSPDKPVVPGMGKEEGALPSLRVVVEVGATCFLGT